MFEIHPDHLEPSILWPLKKTFPKRLRKQMTDDDWHRYVRDFIKEANKTNVGFANLRPPSVDGAAQVRGHGEA